MDFNKFFTPQLNRYANFNIKMNQMIDKYEKDAKVYWLLN